MTFREALEVFLNLDKNKQGVGGRNADKKIKGKGDLNKLKTKRSIKGTYKDYGDIAFQNDDSEMNDGGVGHKPSRLAQGF